MTIIIFSKYLQFDGDSRNKPKKLEKSFFGKFGKLSRGYLSSTVNVLTNSPKISHITKRDIFQIFFPQSDGKYDKIAPMQISQVFRTL